ncbi:MAG TPA: type II secretion system minor pseudopilin GspK [Casimicrobiaceae bacterium]|nr:type II secretion system minor pseudopilin GspK [Casimicrobiaceae bacterium]
MTQPRRGTQRGAAIVIAMLLAAFAAVVAAGVLADQQRWTRNVEHRRDAVQAQATAMAGVQWARQILYDDARTSVIDHLGEPWALQLPPIPLDNGEIRGAIADAQSRLNVNALGDDAAAVERMRLARLFAQRGGPVAALDSIADWIDRDSATRAGGAEDAWYRAQTVPMLAANAPVLRVAEIATVRNVSYEALAAVRPYITALPPRTPLNVNTAPAEVLAAVLDNASPEALAAIISGRKEKPYTTVAEFRARLPQGVHLSSEEMLDVRSGYFEVTVEARQGASTARARALVHREADRWPSIVWQVVE